MEQLPGIPGTEACHSCQSPVHQELRRKSRTGIQIVREVVSSRNRRQERGKSAGEIRRKDGMGQGRERSTGCPPDFAAHERWLSMLRYRPVLRRARLYHADCRRCTSHGGTARHCKRVYSETLHNSRCHPDRATAKLEYFWTTDKPLSTIDNAIVISARLANRRDSKSLRRSGQAVRSGIREVCHWQALPRPLAAPHPPRDHSPHLLACLLHLPRYE